MAAPDEQGLFLAALAQPAPERAAFLRGIADPELRERVALLLVAHDALGDDDPIGDVLPRVAPPPLECPGFRILREVGRGGMGVVYEAEQTRERRRVAIKTLAEEHVGSGLGKRLEQEARLLAKLTHPGIAQVHGSGVAAGGAPFLVLEFVDGETLDRFVQRHGTAPAGRVRLLAEIAEAVAHAHARGVVHRDLKPGNVLVTAAGRPKVLDFGIARLVERPAPGSDESLALLTRPGTVLGTLPYMAPEQFGAHSDAIDPRLDVYALGVIAYELLGGRLPFDVKGLTLVAAARVITEHEPQRLGALQRGCRGDVELVVGKAMAREPGDRYASAAELAADLRRLLAHEPVLAHPPSRTYLLRKLVARHRAAALALATTFLFLAVALWRVAVARDEAVAAGERETRRAAAARQLAALFAGIVDRATPQVHGGAPEPITAVIDDLARALPERAGDDPWVRGRLHTMFADARHRAGDTAAAIQHATTAASCFADSDMTTARDRVQLAIVQARLRNVTGDADAAENGLRVALVEARGIADGGDEQLACLHELANTLAATGQRLEDAEALAQEGVDLAIRLGGRDGARHASALHSLAIVQVRRGRLPLAIANHEKVVALREAAQPDSLALATALQNLSHALQLDERQEPALTACQRAIAIQRRVHGERRHRDLGFSLDVAGSLLRSLGRHAEALPLFAEAEQHFVAQCGPRHVDVAVCLCEWGITLDQMGRVAEAGPLLERAVAIHREIARDTAAFAAALEALANAWATTPARRREAIGCAEEALALRQRVHGDGDLLVCRSLEVLGTLLLFDEQWSRCETIGRDLLARRRAHHGDDHWLTHTHASLCWIPLTRTGRHAEARDLAARAAAVFAATLPPTSAWLRHALEAERDLAGLAGDAAGAAASDAKLRALPTPRR